MNFFSAAFTAAVLQMALIVPGNAGLNFNDERPSIYQPDRAGHAWNPVSAGVKPVLVAQAGDPRLPILEEEIRQLNGRVEELNFLVLQMQEQLRRLQEDNEFRFQQLEGVPDGATPQEKKSEQTTDSDNRVADTGTGGKKGEPPINLGSITINPDGSIKSATIGEPMDLVGRSENREQADGTIVAALPATDDPEELYANAYEFMLSGDYPTAELAFREHIERFPEDARSADARYWLGEAVLSQQRPAEAAEIFLAASRDYPDATKAPDTLLKLGISLSALNQRDIACATFNEIGVRYPQASDLLKDRVRQEKAIAGC